MKKLIVFVLFVIGSCFPLCAQVVNGEILYDTCNMTVVKLWGTSYERGYAYGYLLGDRIIELYEGYTIPLFGEDWPEVMSIVAQGDAFHIDSAYWNEAQALMDGVTAAGYNSGGYTSLDVIAGNCTYDFAFWPFGKKDMGPHCSTFVNWNDATGGTDLDGRSVIARHGDGQAPLILTDNFVIVIHIPSEENLQPWLHMGYAGEMASTANLNSSGYFISANALHGQAWNPDTAAGYEPIVFMMRKAMESIDYNQDSVNNLLDIKDIISANENGYGDGSAFTFMGPSTAVYDSMIAMVAEVAPNEPFITFRTNSFPDSIPGDNLYAANMEIARNNSMYLCSRYLDMINHMGPGTNIGSQENWDLMKNYSNSGYINLYFLQFIPEWDQLKICVHKDGTPAYQNDPVIFDLKEFWQIPVSIHETKGLSEEFYASPNPFTNYTTLAFRLYKPENVQFTVYNVQSQIVYTIEEWRERGEQQMQWNAEGLPAGMYYYRMVAGKQIGSGKLVIK